MWKKVLLALPIVLCLLSCEGLSFGGNANEGSQRCSWISKEFVSPLGFEMSVTCSDEKICKAYFMYWGINISDSLRDKCFSGYELDYITKDTSMLVRSMKTYPISFDSDSHLRFSLLDINNVEKKYDIDLSGIVNSYTIRGDTVDLNVMENCSLHLYHCKKETIYGNQLNGEKYSFFTSDGCDKDYSYDCTWHNLGPSRKDDLEISSTIYWSK